MNAVNLYILSKNVEIKDYSLYEKCMSGRDEEIKTRKGELSVISNLVDGLISRRSDSSCIDDWFYSFTIPHISKEFDLLKIGTNNVTINIEIKEQQIEVDRIITQLEKNRYYLSIVSKTVHSFVCIRKSKEHIAIYMLKDKSLDRISISELANYILLIENPIKTRIEELFRANDYLISPINTPKNFLKGQYFLSDQQSMIKGHILSGLEEGQTLWGIKGEAGTGKTLLLYDVAKSISDSYSVCIVHSGVLSEGHRYLSSMMTDVNIVGAKNAVEEELIKYDIICVDETQRLYKSTLELIIELHDEKKIKACVFAYDYLQCLSKIERYRNNPESLRKLKKFKECELSTRIRTNKTVFSFIRRMMYLLDKPSVPMVYDCIDIQYAKTDDEADMILNIYQKKGYKFITFTPSQYVSNSIDRYSKNINSHQVIGQEFDDVVIILDDNFRYGSDGKLQAREHPNPDYLFPKLFYQNITRAREKLCIIVLNNYQLFHVLINIKANSINDISSLMKN